MRFDSSQWLEVGPAATPAEAEALAAVKALLPDAPTAWAWLVPHLINVPEVREGWLCSACRRPPGVDIVFPVDYLRNWVGSLQGTRRTRKDGWALDWPVGSHEGPLQVPPRWGR